MEYIAITNDSYLSHHGVKGMKWGVHKARPFAITQRGVLGKRASGKLLRGSVIGYAAKNRKGVVKQKAYLATPLERVVLKKMKVINNDGSITTQRQREQAQKYCTAMKGVAIGSAAVYAAGQIGMLAIRMKTTSD